MQPLSPPPPSHPHHSFEPSAPPLSAFDLPTFNKNPSLPSSPSLSSHSPNPYNSAILNPLSPTPSSSTLISNHSVPIHRHTFYPPPSSPSHIPHHASPNPLVYAHPHHNHSPQLNVAAPAPAPTATAALAPSGRTMDTGMPTPTSPVGVSTSGIPMSPSTPSVPTSSMPMSPSTPSVPTSSMPMSPSTLPVHTPTMVSSASSVDGVIPSPSMHIRSDATASPPPGIPLGTTTTLPDGRTLRYTSTGWQTVSPSSSTSVLPFTPASAGGMLHHASNTSSAPGSNHNLTIALDRHGGGSYSGGSYRSDGMITFSSLVLPEVGAYKDLRSKNKLRALPNISVINGESAARRLVDLKNRLNELHRIRKGYWAKQGASVGAGVASAALTMGVGLVASGVAVVHQCNRLEQVKKAMRAVILQINQLRANFAGDGACLAAECQVNIEKSVFSKGIARSELSGSL